MAADHYSVIHHLYETFYRKMYKNPKYKFDPSDKALGYIDTFLSLLDKKYKLETIDTNFLILYFIFQFEYWSKLQISSFNERINIQFIIGKKAFERFTERDKKFDYKLYLSQFVTAHGISINEIKKFFSEEETHILNKAEELEKKRFHNTYEGFLNCILRTTLYHHQSKLCMTCGYKDDCKKLLSNNFSTIYKARGYAATTVH